MPYKDPIKRKEYQALYAKTLERKKKTYDCKMRWAAENRTKDRDSRFRRHIAKAYNLTVDQYNQMLNAQNGVCDICGNVETSKAATRLGVDHNHSTGKVRGLLCTLCNSGLGSYKDNIENMQRAIVYLQKHSLDVPPNNHSEAS